MASSASAQQPAQQINALQEEFDIRMSNIVCELAMSDTIFFSKHISKCMATKVVTGQLAYTLEFPRNFLVRYGNKFGTNVTFETTDSHQTWPIKLTIRTFEGPRARLFANGLGGWRDFVMDNHIKVGDILIFKLVRMSHFEVVIGRSPRDQDNAHEDNLHQASFWDNSSNNAHEDNVHQASFWNNSCHNLPLLPKFRVTICRPSKPKHPENHFYLEKDLSLIVPSHFWELHSRMLQYDELQLKGPTKNISMVKVERTYNVEVPKVHLGHFGWKAFVLANNLAVGDILEFSLVANSSFTVDVVEQIERH